MVKEKVCLKLDNKEVYDYFKDVQTGLIISTSENQSLKGIWKDAGFEKIVDLEDEIYRMRQELQDSILRRVL